MDDWHLRYRYVLSHRLWRAVPDRERPVVAHIRRRNTYVARCGLRFEGPGPSNYPLAVAMHVTLARAIDAADCRQCLRGL